MTAEGRPFCQGCGIDAAAVAEMIYCDLWACWLCMPCCEAADEGIHCACSEDNLLYEADPLDCCYRNGACEA